MKKLKRIEDYDKNLPIVEIYTCSTVRRFKSRVPDSSN